MILKRKEILTKILLSVGLACLTSVSNAKLSVEADYCLPPMSREFCAKAGVPVVDSTKETGSDSKNKNHNGNSSSLKEKKTIFVAKNSEKKDGWFQSGLSLVNKKWSSLKKKAEKAWNKYQDERSLDLKREKIEKEMPEFALAKDEVEKIENSVKAAKERVKNHQLVKTVRSNRKMEFGEPVASDGNVEKAVQSKELQKNFIVERIEKFSIGEEEKLTFNNLEINKFEFPTRKLSSITKFETPKEADLKDIEKDLMKREEGLLKDLEKKKRLDKQVAAFEKKKLSFDLEKILSLDEITKEVAQAGYSEKKIEELSEEDFRKIVSRVMVKSGKCHRAIGVLLENRGLDWQGQKMYMSCLGAMGLFSDLVQELKKLKDPLKGDQILLESAKFVKDTSYYLYSDLLPSEKSISNSQLNKELKSRLLFLKSIVGFEKASLQESFNLAKKVAKGTKYFERAQLLKGVILSELNKEKEAFEIYKKLYQKESIKNDEMYGYLLLNLARTAFQNKKYSHAVMLYRQIPKNHPLWIDALIEQGWSQLLSGDPEGAVGNMFSLQTKYLSNVYKAAAYPIRTIGYLNLCQYADAYKTLTAFENTHRPWLGEIENFKRQKPSDKKVHGLLLSHLKDKKLEINLPKPVVVEAIRMKNVLVSQKLVNQVINEQKQLSFVNKLVTSEKEDVERKIRRLKKERSAIELKLKAGKKLLKAARAKLKRERRKIVSELNLLKSAKKYFVVNERLLLERSKEIKSNLQKIERSSVVETAKRIRKNIFYIGEEIHRLLENNEFLRFEVFSGSGENLRAYGQGVDTKKKVVSAKVKPKSKDLSWEFDGEIWLDEIGNYRSSLKNNCSSKKRKSFSFNN